MSHKAFTKTILVVGLIIQVLIWTKWAWIRMAIRHHGSFETEKKEILARSEYLASMLIASPEEVIVRMPKSIGPQFQGEWALYSCSMYTAALFNIVRLYPENREESIKRINQLIRIVMSPELKRYDAVRWGEDPLEDLSGDVSHISYLSHLAWMIGGFRMIGGGQLYDDIYDELCETMNRRILQSPILNLPTYPEEAVYVPDMLVAIVALAEYARQHKGTYASTVEKWKNLMLEQYVDTKTGLIQSFIWPEMPEVSLPVKGSYSALNCYYLTLIDPDLAKDQYERLKQHFLKERPITGMKEYADKSPFLAFDMDAGPIICGLSPTGTAFATGSATFFQDTTLRRSILETAEQAGTTLTFAHKSHYILADFLLVGEAIMLAMRTNLANDYNVSL